jgi:hypothetical protein
MGVRNLDGRPFNFLFLANFGAKVKEYRSVKFCQLMSALYFMSLEVFLLLLVLLVILKTLPREGFVTLIMNGQFSVQRSRKNSGRK